MLQVLVTSVFEFTMSYVLLQTKIQRKRESSSCPRRRRILHREHVCQHATSGQSGHSFFHDPRHCPGWFGAPWPQRRVHDHGGVRPLHGVFKLSRDCHRKHRARYLAIRLLLRSSQTIGQSGLAGQVVSSGVS